MKFWWLVSLFLILRYNLKSRSHLTSDMLFFVVMTSPFPIILFLQLCANIARD